MPAELLLHRKQVTSDNEIVEFKIWKVPKDVDFPEGIRYSMGYIHNGKRVLGYDNERGKGHHKHKLGKEEKVQFVSWQMLLNQFLEELKEV